MVRIRDMNLSQQRPGTWIERFRCPHNLSGELLPLKLIHPDHRGLAHVDCRRVRLRNLNEDAQLAFLSHPEELALIASAPGCNQRTGIYVPCRNNAIERSHDFFK